MMQMSLMTFFMLIISMLVWMVSGMIDRGPVHDLGDVVVTLGTLRAPGTWDGKPMVDHLAYTMVWVRVEGKWSLLCICADRTTVYGLLLNASNLFDDVGTTAYVYPAFEVAYVDAGP
jgi:hypothetical protein